MCRRPCIPARKTRTTAPSASPVDERQVFDSLDKDGSGYVDEQEWRRLTEDTPLAASDDTFLFIERVRHHMVSTACYTLFLQAFTVQTRLNPFPALLSTTSPGTRREDINRGSSERGAPIRRGCRLGQDAGVDKRGTGSTRSSETSEQRTGSRRANGDGITL